MAIHLQKEISKMKKKILGIGAKVEEAFEKAIQSIESRSEKLSQEVMQHDYEIDQMEVDLEEECLKILALYQPVAYDLRLVIAILKINNDLERIGDLAANLAERGFDLSHLERINDPFDLQGMAAKVKTMLRESLDALVNSDLEQARKVCRQDQEVDEINRASFQLIQEAIKKDVSKTEILMHFISISRYLERIADHATNIAEDVVYMIEGSIIRHSGLR